MRMPFANKALASALTLLTAASTGSAQSGRAALGPSDLGTPQWATAPAVAQYEPPPGYNPGSYGVPGAMFQPQYGTMPPAALYPPQAPSTMNPWPEVSPFHPPNVSYTQHQNKKGLWFRDTVHRHSDYEFGIEYLLTSFQEPGRRTVGSNYQPLYNIDGTLVRLGQQTDPQGLGPAQNIGTNANTFPGAFPFAVYQDGDGVAFVEDGRFYPIHNVSSVAGGLDSNGIKLNWGVMHEDGTGWNLSGFYAGETEAVFGRGQQTLYDVQITQDIILANPQLLSALVGGLPLVFSNQLYGTDGNTPGYLGDTQKYDLLYQLNYSTFAAGTQFKRYNGLIHKGEAVKVTSYYGARYMYLDENFKFHGIDSGFGYEFEVDGDDNENFGRPDGLTAADFAYPMMDSRLNSKVQSHMAGPQVGFRIDLGNRGAFHLFTETTGALLANHEILEVNGNNIGVAVLRPDMHDGTQFLDNSFRDRKSHTHVSPLFEQSIYADIQLQTLLPVLKRNYLLENANLRVGYTFTWVGEVSRPGNSINWQGFPRTPTVNVDREDFTMNQLNVGLSFPY